MNGGLLDCIVIGGGPAGLTAAIYLGRYRRHVAVFDDGRSRAALIPRTQNYPGFAHGITGPNLLAALTEQAERYGVNLIKCEAQTLAREGQMFRVTGDGADFRASRAIMATGLSDTRPEIEGFEPGADGSLVRYCPICDGYEATDKEICVFGGADQACDKALFLRTFSKSVTLLTPDGRPGSEKICKVLVAAGVRLPDGSRVRLRQDAEKIVASFSDASEIRFDLLYPILGCAVRSELATRLGAHQTDVGCLIVDDHLQTTVPGLYAVGDIVSDLHQIAVGTGHAAIAATHIHNSLPRNFR
jgi:thioredoxin reductase (NADPH)